MGTHIITRQHSMMPLGGTGGSILRNMRGAGKAGITKEGWNNEFSALDVPLRGQRPAP